MEIGLRLAWIFVQIENNNNSKVLNVFCGTICFEFCKFYFQIWRPEREMYSASNTWLLENLEKQINVM